MIRTPGSIDLQLIDSEEVCEKLQWPCLNQLNESISRGFFGRGSMVYSIDSIPVSHQNRESGDIAENNAEDGRGLRILKLCWQPPGRQSEAEHFRVVNSWRQKWSHIGGTPRLRSFGHLLKLSDGFRGTLSRTLGDVSPVVAQRLVQYDRELRVLVFEDIPICKAINKFPIGARPTDFLLLLYRFLKRRLTLDPLSS